jgi:hypothetical protein
MPAAPEDYETAIPQTSIPKYSPSGLSDAPQLALFRHPWVSNVLAATDALVFGGQSRWQEQWWNLCATASATRPACCRCTRRAPQRPHWANGREISVPDSVPFCLWTTLNTPTTTPRHSGPPLAPACNTSTAISGAPNPNPEPYAR